VADNRLPGGKPSWRQGAKPVPGAAPQKKSKGRQVFVVLGTMLFLVGVAAAWLLSLRPVARPSFLPVAVTQYRDKHLPVNAQADDDRTALGNEAFFGAQLTKGYDIQERDQILQEFGDLKKKAKTDAVVVYLCAHVLTDAKGELFLLPAHADVDRPETWIELRRLLEALKDCPSQKKLLVLDVFRPIADPRLGVLANDVAARLPALLEQVPDDDRLVLAACSPGQVTVSSEDLGQSVFGFYLEEGLRGWADGYGSRGKDGRVTVDELARFVRARADRWVRQNHDARQTPVLYGPEKLAQAFELVALTKEPTPPAKAVTVDPYPEWLQYGWQLRDLWWNDGSVELSPRTFRKLEAALLRAEQLWRGGVRAKQLETDLDTQLAQFRKEIDRAWAAVPRPDKPRSLALAAALPRRGSVAALDEARKAALAKAAAEKAAAEKAAAEKGDGKKDEKPTAPPPAPKKPDDEKPAPRYSLADNVEDLRKLLNQLDESRGVDPKEAVKVREGRFKEFLARFKDKPEFDLAWTAFEAAAQDVTPRADRIRNVNELLALGGQTTPRYVETLLLRRLGELTEQMAGGDQPPWPTEAVSLALKVARNGERAAALDPQRDGGWEPRALPWVRAALESAWEKRHDAEVLLFHPGYGSARRAVELFRDADADYQTVLGYLENLQAAFRVHDKAFALLPALAPALLRLPEVDPRDEKTWHEAASTLLALRRTLYTASGAEAPGALRDRVNDVQRRAQTLGDQLDALLRPYTTDLATTIEKVRRADALPALWPDVEAALAVPFLDGKQRVELWNASRLLAGRLNEKTRNTDLEDARREHPTDPPSEPDANRAAAQEARRAAWRAQVAVDLFRLGGLNGIDKLEAEVADAGRDPASVKNWAELGEQLRRCWGEDVLAKQLKEDFNPAARDQLSRVAHPFEDPPTLSEVDAHPSLELHRNQAREVWGWLYDHALYALQENKGLRLAEDARAVDGVCQDFYQQLRDDYQRLAGDKPATGLVAELIDKSNRPQFTTAGRTEPYALQVVLSRPAAKPDLEVRAETPDPAWVQFQVSAQPTLRTGETAVEAAVEINVPRDAGESGTPQPKGFLVAARVNGRSFHHRVPLSLPTPENQTLQLLLAKNPQRPDDASGDKLALRPNVPQAVYVFVKNPTKQEKHVNVEVIPKGNPKGGARTAKPVTVKPGGEPVLVPLESLAPVPAPPAGQQKVVLPDLTGPVVIQMRDADRKDEPIGKPRELDVEVERPNNYVRIAKLSYEAAPKNRLSVTVQATQPIIGPPCRVRLELPLSRNPGLVRPPRGNTEDTLDAEHPEVVLTAEDLQFAGPAFQRRFPGWFYLHVDGYERAFIFRALFVVGEVANAPQPERFNGRELRVVVPKVMRPETAISPRIEVDNAPDVTLVVGQDRTQSGRFTELRELPGGRRVRRGFSPAGPDGGLLFEVRVDDWTVQDLDVRGLRKPWDLRVRMLQGGTQIMEDKKTILVDDTPPEGVKITTLNKRPVPRTTEGQPLTLERGGQYVLMAEGRDPESGIKEVYFFPGEPEGDGENQTRPPKVRPIPAEPVGAERTQWWARVLIPNSPQTERVSVQFVNEAGMSSFDTLYVQVVPPDPNAGKAEAQKPAPPKNGTLSGRVTENDRPQQGIIIVLRDLDDAMAKPRRATTNAQGRYVFKDVKPGSYQVEAYRTEQSRSPNVQEKKAIEAGADETLNFALVFGP
jgi:Carboxypeptidase regulatory-like domain